MNKIESRAANRLVDRWRSGDTSSWSALKVLVEKQLIESVDRMFWNQTVEIRDRLKTMVPDIYGECLRKGELDPASMKSFQTYCATAMRHISVQLYRYLH